MKLYAIIITLLLLTPTIEAQNNKNLLKSISKKPTIWYRADLPGDTIGQWQDYSKKGHKLALDSAATFTSGAINFHPALERTIIDKPFKLDFVAKKKGQIKVYTVYQSNDTINENGLWVT